MHREISATIHQSWLLIFARAPQLGRVKTRLAHDIGEVAASQFYAAMLRDTIDFARELSDVQIALSFTPRNAFDANFRDGLAPFWNGARVAQLDGDLGEKMRGASDWAFAQGAQRVALIGSDSPDLPREIITQSFAQLQQNCEMTISPAQDGGFALLGLAQSAPPQLFAGIDWTQNQTRRPLIENAKRLHWQVGEVACWQDVDEGNDLRALQSRLRRSSAAPHCARWLRNNARKYLPDEISR